MTVANYNSDANYDSHANYGSDANYDSHTNYNSDANYCSDANYNSHANYNSDANYNSHANYLSHANCNSHANYLSYANYSGRALYKCMFTFEQTAKSYMIFSTIVNKKRADTIRKEYIGACGGWIPEHTDIFDFYIKEGKDWSKVKPQNQTLKGSYQESWKDMPSKALEYIRSIPEFDAAVFEKITGIKANDNSKNCSPQK